MPWLLVLPLIADLLKACLKLIPEVEGKDERRLTKEELREALDDFARHQSIDALRANLEQLPESWKPRLRDR